MTYYLLPTAYYLLLTTYYWLPTTHYLLLTTCHLLLTTDWPLPTTYYLLLTPYHLPPATHYLVLNTHCPLVSSYLQLEQLELTVLGSSLPTRSRVCIRRDSRLEEHLARLPTSVCKSHSVPAPEVPPAALRSKYCTSRLSSSRSCSTADSCFFRRSIAILLRASRTCTTPTRDEERTKSRQRRR